MQSEEQVRLRSQLEKEWKHTVAVTSSFKAVLIGPGALIPRIALKAWRDSRAISACFLNAASVGMVVIVESLREEFIRKAEKTNEWKTSWLKVLTRF